MDDTSYEQVFKPIMRAIMGTYDPKAIVLQVSNLPAHCRAIGMQYLILHLLTVWCGLISWRQAWAIQPFRSAPFVSRPKIADWLILCS